MEREIPLERLARNARLERAQMGQLTSQLREPVDERAHPRSARSFNSRMRRSHGSRSAARI